MNSDFIVTCFLPLSYPPEPFSQNLLPYRNSHLRNELTSNPLCSKYRWNIGVPPPRNRCVELWFLCSFRPLGGRSSHMAQSLSGRQPGRPSPPRCALVFILVPQLAILFLWASREMGKNYSVPQYNSGDKTCTEKVSLFCCILKSELPDGMAPCDSTQGPCSCECTMKKV